MRTAAAVDGRRVLTFRVTTDAMADPGPEPSVLAAEFCPRTSWNDRGPNEDPAVVHPFG
ncbi:hypothetical protein FHS32_000906 [Streptomyces albaduncus]|uniref:Uncharacterized protein n=1 Tax=Streptomyces griseoloalbus TaxID=67303 RepID=A0A7W8BK45_9ACTN|nr:hypothetical protein [Streptomyces albaduncus]